jgi:cytochrome c553
MKKILVLASLLFATSIFAADGATLFKTCATCHGAKAEKAALNKSQVIGGWDAAKIEAALHGYKAGTYGGPLKGTMAAQVKNLDDASIKALASYISSLK